MKKIFTFLTAVLLTAIIFGQSPEGFKYQAVLRDASGDIMADASANIQIAILQGSTTGTEVFTETHSTATNAFGLVNLEIGSVNSTDLEAIDWAAGPYYVKISVDGTEMGTSQLLSVPYALYAKNVANTYNQELTISGHDLSITGGNTITLPIQDTMWRKEDNVVYTDYSVGIAISNPQAELHLNGQFILGTDESIPDFGTSAVLNTDHGILYQAGGTNWAHHFAAYGTGDIARFGNNTGVNDEPDIKAVIDNEGNMGLGTDLPSRKLHIQVDSNGLNIPLMVHNLDETETGGNAVGIGFNNEPGGGYVKAGIAHERTAYHGTGTLHFLLDNTGDNSDVTLSDSKMSITREGNVGIGITDPQVKLHFDGPFIFGTDENMPGFSTSSVLNTDHGMLYQGGGDVWAHHFVAYSTGDIARFGNSTGVNDEPDIKAVIDNEGNMGLGTDLPSRKLHIQVNSNGLNIPLMVHNLDETESGGNAVGIGFNNEPGGDWVKAAIAHERTAYYGTGTMHFLIDNTADNSTATLSDSKMSITREGNVGIGTTEPASKFQVKDGDVYVESIGSGIILKSPDGSCWRITVDNSGTLSTVSVTCPQ